MIGLTSPTHIALLLVVLLLVFGAKRLPELGHSLGHGMREFKDSLSGASPLEHPGPNARPKAAAHLQPAAHAEAAAHLAPAPAPLDPRPPAAAMIAAEEAPRAPAPEVAATPQLSPDRP